uniref:Uncharacterized protein n=1 Tax=Strigamia maritima TaxID=126957 RepID=T1JG79_STRMM
MDGASINNYKIQFKISNNPQVFKEVHYPFLVAKCRRLLQNVFTSVNRKKMIEIKLLESHNFYKSGSNVNYA